MKQTLKRILAILLVFIFIVQASPLQFLASSLHSDECEFLADAGEADSYTCDSVGNITSFTFTPHGFGTIEIGILHLQQFQSTDA